MKKLYEFKAKIGNKDVSVFISKPTQSDIEDAEYISAQKFNILLQEGFLSKAMMNKKFGDIGGIFSEKSNKELSEAVVELLEAKKRIEFYGGAKELTGSQKQELDEANQTFAILQKKIVENDIALQSMFSKSADTKAEEHMIRWFILNTAYFVDEVNEGEQKKSQDFKLFDKPTFQEKLVQFNQFMEDAEEFDSDQVKLKKEIIAKHYPLIGRVIAIWYNGYGSDQESIQRSLEELFPEEPPVEKEEVKKKRGRKSSKTT